MCGLCVALVMDVRCVSGQMELICEEDTENKELEPHFLLNSRSVETSFIGYLASGSMSHTNNIQFLISCYIR